MTKHRRVRGVFQLVGFLVGLALLGWCLRNAFGPENQDQLRRLADAPPSRIILLTGLSLASLILNGVMFWAAIAPVHRISCVGICATNAVATFASYLPFKLSVVVRVLIHTRHDKLPFFTIGAWLTAVAVLMMVALMPMALGAWLSKGLDPLAWAITGVGAAVLTGLTIAVARYYAGERGLARFWRLVDTLRLGPVSRFARSDRSRQFHRAFAVLAHARSTAGGVALRLLDTGVQAWRFVVAAEILGIPMAVPEAVILSLVYFLVSVFTPIGVLGSREAATAAVAVALGLRDELRDTDLPLLVTATESIVNLAGAAVGIAILRPARLLALKRRVLGGSVTDRGDGSTPRSAS